MGRAGRGCARRILPLVWGAAGDHRARVLRAIASTATASPASWVNGGIVGRHLRTQRTTVRASATSVPDLLERRYRISPRRVRWMYLASVLISARLGCSGIRWPTTGAQARPRRAAGRHHHLRRARRRSALPLRRRSSLRIAVVHQACRQAGIRQSVGAVGSSADSAVAES